MPKKEKNMATYETVRNEDGDIWEGEPVDDKIKLLEVTDLADPGSTPFTYTCVMENDVDWVVGQVTWGKPGKFDPDKSCRVHVTTPDGNTHEFPPAPVAAAVSFYVPGPIPKAGTRVILVTVINQGIEDLRNVKVEFGIGQS